MQAEINRLANVRDDFSNDDEWLNYVKDTLETLRSYGVIHDWHVDVSTWCIGIYAEVQKVCYDTVSMHTTRRRY